MNGISKGVVFGLIGCGGLIVIGFIGMFVLSIIPAILFSTQLPNRSAAPNSNTNISNTNIATPTPINLTALRDKAKALAELSPPQKLDPKARLKGKIAVVERDNDNSAEIEGSSQSKTNAFGIPHYRLANTPEEIDSLVQIICTKGKRIGRYQGNITAYANNCKVSLIDYRNNFIFAQKTLINSDLYESVSSVYDNGDYINPPSSEIEPYLKSFGATVLPEVTDAAQLPNIEDSKTFASEPSQFGRLNFPVKLDSNAKIKGKITIVQVRDYEADDNIDSGSMIGLSLDGTLDPPLPNSIILTKESSGFTDDQIAMKSSEIETLIQVRCKRGSFITKAKGTSVFSNICTVNIIDYKGLAVVAQKTFEGRKVNYDRYTSPSDYADDGKKDTVDFPRAEIEEYIKSFPKG